MRSHWLLVGTRDARRLVASRPARRHARRPPPSRRAAVTTRARPTRGLSGSKNVDHVEPLYAIVDSTPNGMESRLIGAKVHLRTIDGVTAESVSHALACHAAQETMSGRDVGDSCPYAVPGVWVDIDVKADSLGLRGGPARAGLRRGQADPHPGEGLRAELSSLETRRLLGRRVSTVIAAAAPAVVSRGRAVRVAAGGADGRLPAVAARLAVGVAALARRGAAVGLGAVDRLRAGQAAAALVVAVGVQARVAAIALAGLVAAASLRRCDARRQRAPRAIPIANARVFMVLVIWSGSGQNRTSMAAMIRVSRLDEIRAPAGGRRRGDVAVGRRDPAVAGEVVRVGLAVVELEVVGDQLVRACTGCRSR